MAYKILGKRQFFTNTATISIVAIKTNTHEPDDVLEWKAYIDCGQTDQLIAATGSGLSAVEAQGFFPSLDITKYKNY